MGKCILYYLYIRDNMTKSSKPVVKYIKKDHIFAFNMSGRMTSHELARRAEALRNCLKCNLKNNKTIKVLADYRNLRWDSEETHYKAREIIDKHLMEFREYNHFSAILNDRYEGQTSEHEFLFTKEQNALAWLRSKKNE